MLPCLVLHINYIRNNVILYVLYLVYITRNFWLVSKILKIITVQSRVNPIIHIFKSWLMTNEYKQQNLVKIKL